MRFANPRLPINGFPFEMSQRTGGRNGGTDDLHMGAAHRRGTAHRSLGARYAEAT